ncbi:Predicted Zn-dependent peptidase [Caldanaerobius fijiensis DSM 17918]|uniref:Predicted Zn-dependent peptidase n=1 Tax=Caldanaerobius fijiensis DSM 17918 TaxID=1121256 RepID=A0A1M4T3U2_9THEO|nr:pitrilysin family protein [Caldanaerobius fijiensis]SHE38998.1 Predicted Zn-dependent peptidase [Caldanaerobius fijiensis DSM 17918]
MREIIKNNILNEEIVHHLTPSGLNVFVMPKKGYTKQYAIYATHYGSNDSKFIVPGEDKPTEVPDGIAHFLEHKMFEEEHGNIFDEYSKLGASANAFTNFNMTAYLFSSTDRFYDCLKVLVGFVQRPYFTDENVEKEKGIIGQEIRMYEDDPNWRVYFNALDALYKVHPVKIDIAGTIESISKINKDLLYKCYYTFYTPQNMVLFVVGDVDSEEVFRIADEMVKPGKVKGEVVRIYPDEPKSVNKTQVVQDMMVSIPLFNIGFKDTDVGYDGYKLLKKGIEMEIALNILIGKSSRLYNDLYDSGLIDNDFGFDFESQKDYGHSIIGGESREPYAVMDAIVKEVERIKKEGIAEGDFDRIKRFIKGRYIKMFNSVENIAHAFVSYYMKGISIFDVYKAVEEVKIQDINSRFEEHFNNPVISIINPISAK